MSAARTGAPISSSRTVTVSGKGLQSRLLSSALIKSRRSLACWPRWASELFRSRQARQLLVQFLTLNVSARVTAVPQIGWHCSDGVWVFVLPDDTIVPAGFDGPRPVLQTASLHVQHGIDVRGSVDEWIEQIARPLVGNSNVHLCVGTMFAGPLLKFANEQPGLFHLWGTSKIGKSLAGATGQSVYGRPKVPGEADAFGASWTATAVGLERYAVLRSDVGAYFR